MCICHTQIFIYISISILIDIDTDIYIYICVSLLSRQDLSDRAHGQQAVVLLGGRSASSPNKQGPALTRFTERIFSI